MAVSLIKYEPQRGDYVYVTRPRTPLAAGRVTNVLAHERTVAVRLAGTQGYIYASYAQLSRHPQNDWGA